MSLSSFINIFKYVIFIVFLSSSSTMAAPSVTAYFEEWGIYENNYHVSDLPSDQLTHINYAFAQIDTSGEIALFDRYAAVDHLYTGDTAADAYHGNFNQLKKLKATHPDLQIAISIGGWTLSQPFYTMASTQAGRERFSQSVLRFVETYDFFTGVDIDWEYPVIGGLNAGSPADRDNFTLLMKTLRETLGVDYELTVAVSASPRGIDALDYAKAHPYLDRINIMSYDLAGDWSASTGHHSALYDNNNLTSSEFNSDSAVNNLIAAGVPAQKLVLGLAFYGRSFANASLSGINQSFSGPGSSTFSEAGFLTYSDIAANYNNKKDYQYYWDDVAKVPYLYNAIASEFISFDDPRSIENKTRYSIDKGLAGVMYWAASGDNGDLIDAVTKGLDTDSVTDEPTTDEPTTDEPTTDKLAWSGAGVAYAIGDLVTYKGMVYTVVLAHTSIANWYPDSVWYFEQQGQATPDPVVDDPIIDEPTPDQSEWDGAGIDYAIGDLVTYKEMIYKVVLAHTSVANWYPDSIWYFEQQGQADPDPVVDEPIPDQSEWDGSGISYAIGDLVTYKEMIYKVVLAHTSVANWYPDSVWYFEQQ